MSDRINSRAKGAAYERELVRLFREAMPGATVKRGLQFRGAAVDAAADVECPVFWVESKRGRRPQVRAALEQARRDSEGTGKVPIAVIRDDNSPAFVCLGLDAFLAMIAHVWGGESDEIHD